MRKKHIPVFLLAGSLFVGGLTSCEFVDIPSSSLPLPSGSGSELPPSSSLLPPSSSEPVTGKALVTFRFSNGTEDLIVEIDKGEKIDAPSQPEYAGHRFVGWSTTDTGYVAYDFSERVYGDMTLTAIWQAEKVTITFNSNGGTKLSSLTGAPGAELIMPDFPSRPGYIFSGWYQDVELTQGFSAAAFPADDLVLYAKWVAGSSSGSAAIDWPSGDNFYINYTPEVAEIGSAVSFAVAVADMYDISAMEVRVNGVRIYARNGIFSFTVEGDTTVEVTGITTKTYTVTFNSNTGDGSEEIFQATVGYGKTVGAHVFERQGYNLLGFFTDREGTAGFNFNNYIISDTTLYAKWELATYHITYSDTMNSYNPNSTTTFNYFSPTINLLPLYNVPDGVEFAGWTLDGQPVTAIPTGTCGDVELKATWVRKTYSITYDTRQGNEEINSTSGLFGDPIDFPQDPTKDGFFFAGWYTDPQCKVIFDQTTYPAKDVILFAKWSLVPEGSSSISFEGAEGVVISYVGAGPNGNYIKTGSTIKFTLAVKEAEGFSGSVYLQVNGLEVKPDSSGLYTVTINSDTKIKISGITQKTYTVTFMSNYKDGYNFTARAPFNSQFAALDVADPVRLGYVFTGWYSDKNLANLINPNERIVSDITVYAGWELREYTITFLLSGASYPYGSSLTFTIKDGLITLGEATKKGYTFQGFFDSDNRRYITIDPSNELNLRDLTLYARFEIKTYTVVFMNELGNSTYCRYTVNYNSAIGDFYRASDFQLTGYIPQTDYMFTDIASPATSKVTLDDRIAEDKIIYIRVQPLSVTYEFAYQGRDPNAVTLSTTDSGKNEIRDYGSTAHLQLSRPLNADERLLYIDADGRQSYLSLDGDNRFDIVCGLKNILRVVNPATTAVTLIDEAGSGLTIEELADNPLFYIGDHATLTLSAALAPHLRLVANGEEITTDANGQFTILVTDGLTIKVAARERVDVIFRDVMGSGLSLTAVDGNSLNRYVGEKVVFELSGALPDGAELLIETDSYTSYKYVNAEHRFTLVIEPSTVISVVAKD